MAIANGAPAVAGDVTGGNGTAAAIAGSVLGVPFSVDAADMLGL
jgi:hypothetical protein